MVKYVVYYAVRPSALGNSMQRRQITKFPTNFNELYDWGSSRTFEELYNGYERTEAWQGVARVAKANPKQSLRQNYKAETTYSIYNIHIVH